ncbi:autotransporter outer membrane beta-barrel domain-containing protein [Verrucomicrobia bacterium S94]|nr:autotransporter outer membrane beta-barrel domain-containing protein [Verrucomicrobia bacterium S94]
MAIYTRRSIADVGDLGSGSLMDAIIEEIETMAAAGHTAASNQVEILNGLSENEVEAQMKQLYIYSLPTFEHAKGIWGAIDQIRARGSSFHEYGMYGVYGPGYHDPEQSYQPWVKAYGGLGDRDQNGRYDNGYDFNSYGMVLGVDKAFGELLVGLAGGYTGSSLSGDNGDESDADTAYGMLYGSYGTKEWFADVVLSHGVIGMDNTSGTDFDVTSSADAAQTTIYFGLGTEMLNPDDEGSLIKPLIGVQGSLYSQDGYKEKSSTSVARDIESFDRWDCRSMLGAELTVPTYGAKIDFETQLRGYWIHEFNDDDEVVDYTLIDSTQRGLFIMRGPEANLAQFGVGFAAKLENGVKLTADIDGQWGKDYYSAVFSGALLYEF